MSCKIRSRHISFFFRRVHITRATLNELGSKFEVEEGHGEERDEILAKHNVETFLIIPPAQNVMRAMLFYIYSFHFIF